MITRRSIQLALLICCPVLTGGSSLRSAAGAGPAKPDVSRIYGKIQYVDSFPDYKVEVVDAFEDLSVQEVTAFPNGPGKWQIVTQFPDYKIQKVPHFGDFKIRYVSHFPGVHANGPPKAGDR